MIDEDEEEPEIEFEQFKCLALQHKTKDYAATLVRDPTTIIFVHVKDDVNTAATANTKAQ